ncbi:hypothetical protein GEV33_003306 [Tenebrio molitor]|uniref:Uncharacterized protein n=1 Tax=Tenebrio molitor TaxID=7067 RepID=A0A8J6LFF3_TENMO|nr:hypothetical protein GEV33_003306 [Tenebrio molitor]
MEIIKNNTTIATTNPLERSNCRIHLRGRIEVDRSFFPAGVTLERAVESRVWMHVVSKKTIVFLSSSLLPSRSLFCSLAEDTSNKTGTKRCPVSSTVAKRLARHFTFGRSRVLTPVLPDQVWVFFRDKANGGFSINLPHPSSPYPSPILPSMWLKRLWKALLSQECREESGLLIYKLYDQDDHIQGDCIMELTLRYSGTVHKYNDTVAGHGRGWRPEREAVDL